MFLWLLLDQSTINVNDFLDVLLSDPGPQCLMWFPLIHRMASVENVLHMVQCEGCNKESFVGFRYKCQRCYNYQLCQDCFWRCRVSGNHTNQHEMKEYTSYKTPSKQLGHSLKKSILCVPDKPSNTDSHFHEDIIRNYGSEPQGMQPSSNAHHDSTSILDANQSSLKMSQSSFYPQDDDSRLMTHYSRNINASRRGRYSSELNLPSDTARQRELIAKLEAKNREIMREIVHLRKQQEQEEEALNSERNPTLLAELRALRMRKADLERHLSGLQESRRDLMLQLDVLMRMLKDHSPMSSPNSSPFSSMRRSAPFYPLSSMSAPATPGGGSYPYIDHLYGLGGDVRLAFGQAASSRSLQNDLLLAADSVTNAMSSLVKELNLGCEDGENDYLRRCSSYIGNPQIDTEFGYDNESWSNEPDYPNDYYVLDPRDPALQENEIYNTMEPNIFPSGTAVPSSEEANFVHSDEEDNLEWNDRHWIQ